MPIFVFIHACDCIKLVSVSRISHTKVRMKIASYILIRIFFFCSTLFLVGNYPLIRERTQEKNISIAFNMHIFVFIHACDCFSRKRLSYFSYQGKSEHNFIPCNSNIRYFYSALCLVHAIVYFISISNRNENIEGV
jgi:hypothetical protein